jgi:hypothetical protein
MIHGGEGGLKYVNKCHVLFEWPFIPMGGNTVKLPRKKLNLFIVPSNHFSAQSFSTIMNKGPFVQSVTLFG